MLPQSPTIVERKYQVDCSLIATQIAKIKSVNIPPHFQVDVPTGTISCEVILGNFLNGVAFRWWDSGPAEWKELIKAINEIRVYLDNATKE